MPHRGLNRIPAVLIERGERLSETGQGNVVIRELTETQ
ncbi:hypothetical protein X963_5602 [Burkholderia pseudomallei MSHR7498]|nr:hypothetical protein DM75_4042 [Burkholderia mallei]KGS91944.1 hypothetical protein X963_5602 [Burkholderia pseudomallei MSHR7498]KOS74087.1 hypothetical protein DM46_2557 [Burkholderia mallei]KOT11500.1 hypothetical protein DM77_3277 [Burkholderia mallei]KOT16488.1 hypothetical protein DM47_3189 [Burkholderia mallei]